MSEEQVFNIVEKRFAKVGYGRVTIGRALKILAEEGIEGEPREIIPTLTTAIEGLGGELNWSENRDGTVSRIYSGVAEISSESIALVI